MRGLNAAREALAGSSPPLLPVLGFCIPFVAVTELYLGPTDLLAAAHCVTTSAELMAELRSRGLDHLVDGLPCKFTKRGAVHNEVFSLLQSMQESGGISEQVCTWETGARCELHS